MMGCAPATALPEACPTSATKAATAATVFTLLLAFATSAKPVFRGTGFQPRFTEDIVNLTVPVGRDATFRCLVAHLGGYRVGWVKTDTKAIQAIHDHVITHNPRVAVSHSDNSMWNLHIRNVQEEDAGQYMCQMNTDPMTAQIGVLNVVVPPDFIPGETSGDVMVPELGTVKLTCKARGNPAPRIHWRREDGGDIIVRDGGNHKTRVSSYPGENLKLTKVTRADMGAYMCIASNGVPPTISKRITINVHFFPVIHVRNQLVGAPLGTDVTLECLVEASPRSINYWMKGTGHHLISGLTPSSLGIAGDMVISSTKYDVQVASKSLFKVQMTVTIRNLQKDDMGSYRCIAKNSLGEVESNIRLYEIPGPTRLYNMPFDEEDYGEQFGSAERDQDDELFNGAAERGGRPHIHMTLRPPRATYDTLSENHVPFGLAPSCATVTAATAAATTLPLLALVLFVI